jgi:hypothetical protein
MFLCPITAKPVYVGKGHEGRRFEHYKNSSKTHLSNWIRKRQSEGYLINPIVVIENLTETKAFDIECALIAYFGRADLKQGPLFNLTDGGEGASGTQQSLETREKRRQKLLGRVSPMRGRTHTEAALHKIRNATKGIPRDAATKQKISDGLKGKPLSEERKALISIRTKEGMARVKALRAANGN